MVGGSIDYADIDFSVPIKIKTTTIENLTEQWNFSDSDDDGSEPTKKADPFEKHLKNYSAKKVAYPRLNAMRANQGDDSNYGKIPIHDRDGYIDSRSNYAVFMNCIDSIDNNILDRLDYVVGGRKQLTETGCSPQRRPFPLYMSATYVKENYDIDVDAQCREDYENMKRYQQEIKSVLEMDISDLYAYKNGEELNRILNGGRGGGNKHFDDDDDDDLNYADEGFDFQDEPIDVSHQFPATGNTTVDLNSTINRTMDESDYLVCSSLNSTLTPVGNSTELNLSTEFTTLNESLLLETPQLDLQNDFLLNRSESIAKLNALLTSPKRGGTAVAADESPNNRVSVDEGIDSPTICLSEMDPFERSTYTPVVELFDICASMNLAAGEKTEISIQITPEFEQTFCSPAARITAVRTITSFKSFDLIEDTSINCLKLPRKLLRKRLLFSLPPEYACPKYVSTRVSLNLGMFFL